MNITDVVENRVNPRIPQLAPGDTVKVHTKIVEGEKERIQVFQGTVIKMKNGAAGLSFTVRHVAYGVGVERTFPASSPLVEKVELMRHAKVRRAKLYYLRELSGKASRLKVKRLGIEEVAVEPEVVAAAEAQAVPESVAQPEAAAVAQPVATPPAVEAKATEAPKAEAKPEQPKAEAKTEPPKAEARKEQPKSENPPAESK